MVHHNFKKGQKVLVILQSGERIVDKYNSTKGHHLILDSHTIEWKDIRSSTIYKQKGSNQ